MSSGILHSYQSAFKELEVKVDACYSTPFTFLTINNVTGSSTEHVFGSLKPILLVTSEGYTSFCQDSSVSCYEIYISVMSATARLG